MKIWDLRSPNNKPSTTFLLSGDQEAATCIAHHPTQRHLAFAGSENGTIAVWDLRVNTFPASLLKAHSAAVSELQFHPDQPQRMYTCSNNGELWHWNTAQMSKKVTDLNCPEMSINESAINPWLMCEDHSNLEVGSLMSDLHKPINTIDINKKKLICGCDNEAVYVIKSIYQ
jgi:nuclear pore complex protein Nup43